MSRAQHHSTPHFPRRATGLRAAVDVVDATSLHSTLPHTSPHFPRRTAGLRAAVDVVGAPRRPRGSHHPGAEEPGVSWGLQRNVAKACADVRVLLNARWEEEYFYLFPAMIRLYAARSTFQSTQCAHFPRSCLYLSGCFLLIITTA